jgi:hypothetical protein
VAEIPVDMSPAAITDRLRQVGRLLSQQGRRPKGLDMSAAAITGRLRVLGALCDMCSRLARLAPPTARSR